MDNKNDSKGVKWAAKSHQDYNPIFVKEEEYDVDLMK